MEKVGRRRRLLRLLGLLAGRIPAIVIVSLGMSSLRIIPLGVGFLGSKPVPIIVNLHGLVLPSDLCQYITGIWCYIL
jgi:hypothetical protein